MNLSFIRKQYVPFFILALLFLYVPAVGVSQTIKVIDCLRIPVLEHEFCWCGLTADASMMPYKKLSEHLRDLLGENKGNQAQRLLISSKGCYVWVNIRLSINSVAIS
jgi:hypothetical protein